MYDNIFYHDEGHPQCGRRRSHSFRNEDREGGAMHHGGERAHPLSFGFRDDIDERESFGDRRHFRGGGDLADQGEFGFGHRHGRGGRFLEQGDLRWLVLHLIAAHPRHGYEIIKEIEDMFNGQYAPSPGVIYPTLTYLEETGLIASETQANKKLYDITDEGRAELDANMDAIRAILSRIEKAQARFGGFTAPELARAMNNLRSALQIRLGKGPFSPEAVGAVAAILDRAASEIAQS